MAHRRQDEAAELSSLIGDIYDAALNPDLWVPVLEKVCAYVPGSMGNLFSQDIANVANRFFSWGHDPTSTICICRNMRLSIPSSRGQ